MRRIFFGPLSELFNENYGRVIDQTETSDRDVDLFYIKDSSGNRVGAGIDIALPGVTKDSVSVNIEGNKLLIEAKEVSSKENIEYIDNHENINKSEFKTSYNLNQEVFNLNKVTCNMENGILTIYVPFVEKPKARSIKIS